jgi:2-oxoglutarate ferredoxin oxidoreductase subunit alpha
MGREFLEGNEAIARGALKAGCDFFAGYPITPASSILHQMLELVPASGGTAIQAEDEIAAMGFCFGAAMAGRKAMTATSGPGISLCSENVGLAQIGETPLVTVNVQRQGPATGSATKGAEGDIQFTRWVTSGGLPVIALSPATVGEAYELTYRAFNLAEQYRTPVFVLTSKEVGVTRESVELDAIELPPLIERRRVADDEEYLPHRFSRPIDVLLISDFGGPHIARYTTSTHDQTALPTSKPAVIQEMIDHYAAKIDAAADDIALVKRDFQENAETLIISYGITSRSVAVAVRETRERGIKISSLVLQTLWPVPERAIVAALAGIWRVIVPEMNMGQYRLEIERLAPTGVAVIGVNQMNTTLISPAEIQRIGGLLWARPELPRHLRRLHDRRNRSTAVLSRMWSPRRDQSPGPGTGETATRPEQGCVGYRHRLHRPGGSVLQDERVPWLARPRRHVRLRTEAGSSGADRHRPEGRRGLRNRRYACAQCRSAQHRHHPHRGQQLQLWNDRRAAFRDDAE